MFRCILPMLLLLGSSSVLFAGKKADPRSWTERERALHVLNRLTFGFRPGDLERVMSVGVDKWIEQQLQPDSIPDSALDAHLAPLHTIRMAPEDMVAAFPSQAWINQVAQGKAPMPSERNEYSLYEVLLERFYQQRRDAMVKPAAATTTTADTSKSDIQQQDQDRAHRLAAQLLDSPKSQRIVALTAMPVSDRITLATSLRGEARDRLLADFSPAERELFVAMSAPTQVVVGELQQAKLLRAVYSERQLQEVMTDFWFNHFNVFVYKDADQYLTTSFERDAIRSHALGKFRDLLLAVAHSPAMLFYLDNWTSVGPESPSAKALARGPANNATLGLNENYARELLELHTLGVDGGYTQNDVIEVAKVFTGWTIQQPQLAGEFLFDAKRHEPGPKTVLGRTINEAGEQEGIRVLDFLARSPATAKFISTKLARRFVSDDPPPALVARMAQVYLASDGDIREVVRAMVHSREFWSRAVFRAKIKTPLEFVASAIRATGSDLNNAGALQGVLARMGEPLYQCQTPNGYPTTANLWLNSDALIARFNFAVSLTSGKVPGVKFDAPRVLALGVLTRMPVEKSMLPMSADGSQAAVTLLEKTLIGGEISRNTDAIVRKQLQDLQVGGTLLKNPDSTLGTIIAAILGSPEFQRR